jgi:hypothetical protein
LPQEMTTQRCLQKLSRSFISSKRIVECLLAGVQGLQTWCFLPQESCRTALNHSCLLLFIS